MREPSARSISCMRRLRVLTTTVNVVVRDPAGSPDAPVGVEVRLVGFNEEPCVVFLQWKRTWTEEQLDPDKPWKDELPPYTAAELTLAALGGPCPGTVELVTSHPTGYDDERRALSFAIAAGAAEAALMGVTPMLPDGVVYDLTRQSSQ